MNRDVSYSLVIEHHEEIRGEIVANHLGRRLREHRDHRPNFLSGLLSVSRLESGRLVEGTALAWGAGRWASVPERDMDHDRRED
ncbi:MAG: hypothetical protein ACR2HO_02210 [Rubrobacteraceae bacterium]|jgi:hypothetical protein|nr:hypothetical protein [Rubrobacter sp.]